MMDDLFAPPAGEQPHTERLAAGTVLLHAMAEPQAAALLADIDRIAAQSPFRHMVTPGGYRMGVATTSCGELGWVSDSHGYRYSRLDPGSGQPWPAMPDSWRLLAADAAARAGFAGFVPDACLINRYQPGCKLSLHQDKDERDFAAPIVSVSLGLPAVFELGGLRRSERCARLTLRHGDILVWGGPDRLRYHGVLPLAGGEHPLLGECRINLTFRRAG
ncbi:DNA oxidative demethylase AlkB [Vogesella facilis]|uniref:DNA oxidative demethylase AlkB n=1 Tax=Vogesella facilis TaxID=1655232 RepID=A0ABV7RGH6_9NEIS